MGGGQLDCLMGQDEMNTGICKPMLRYPYYFLTSLRGHRKIHLY